MATVEKHVLVIEDDIDVRETLAEELAAAGLHVRVAADGVNGLEQLRRGPPPCVIVLDLRLPRLGGEEFLGVMRADPRFEHIPVITMTAGPDAPDRRDVLAHLEKPFDLDDLRKIVLSLAEPTAA